jgi:CBS domain-containing protein
MTDETIGGVLVRGPHGPVGVLSERDLVTTLAEGAHAVLAVLAAPDTAGRDRQE